MESVSRETGHKDLSKSSPQRFISREEIRAVHAQGEEAIIALVEGLLARIEKLESRVSE